MDTFWDRVTLLLNSPTVVELSTMLDVKRSTLSSWIHTDRRPPLRVAMKITELTGVSLEWLENGNNWESMDREEAAENIAQYKKLIIAQIEELDQQQLEVIQSILYYFKNHTPTNQTLKKDS
ncbi:helix-turn-helix transcriptional regulator [uncultured Sphaerochaeta sp.]|uniref:helix-turn-helix domain-containing protein n=1 Tax=uncultured Sphaerochaeta sp. TaxID=886478 RepID=UPI0029C9E398|nr:helix-turn-helix transcriptional regulator [uncultured Sphaerochaeta sp.]